MRKNNYKAHTIGTITLYGNSCKIKENPNGISEWDKRVMRNIRLRDGAFSRKTPTRKSGDIKAFSKKSRLRLFKKVNRVDFKNKGMPYFITLTYPGRYPTDRETYKSDLDVFIKRLKRNYGSLEYLWRLEAQKRGAPHYHKIVYFDNDIDLENLKKWVSQNWYEVVQREWEQKIEKHRIVGTNCKKVKAYRQLMYYVSKYIGKTEQDKLKNQGRYWGCSQGWEDLLAEDILKGRQLIVFKRMLRKYISKTNPQMAERIKKTQNIEVWADSKFITKLYLWAKDMEPAQWKYDPETGEVDESLKRKPILP